MNNFKLSNKKIYKDNRSTIEYLHDEKMNNIFNEYEQLDNKKQKLKYLEDKLNILQNQNKTKEIIEKIFNIKKEISNISNEIFKIENNHELLDYISNAWEFIENINKNEIKEFTKEITKEVSQYTQDTQNNQDNQSTHNILNYVNKTGKNNKGEEYKRYYDKCFLNINVSNKSSSNNFCKNCHLDNFEIDSKNGIIICTNCGTCEQYLENSSTSINYNDTTHIETISQPFSYQRKNHFKEWLNQLQGKEVTVIPDSVIELIFIEIKKERITNLEDITSERIKKYLKKLKLNKYYEHIPNIISKITNKPSLVITEEFEEILLNLFDKIQEPFKKYCPSNRKNFLSYSYTLHKFCQLLDKYEFLIYFPLLKSREKLFEQEKIWKGICTELNWKFIPSI